MVVVAEAVALPVLVLERRHLVVPPVVGVTLGVAQRVGHGEHVAAVVVGVGGNAAQRVGALHHVVIVVVFERGLHPAAQPHLLHGAPALVPAVVRVLVARRGVVHEHGLVAVVAYGLVGAVGLEAAHHAGVVVGNERLVALGVGNLAYAVGAVVGVEGAEAHGVGALLEPAQAVVLVGDAAIVERGPGRGEQPVGVSEGDGVAGVVGHAHEQRVAVGQRCLVAVAVYDGGEAAVRGVVEVIALACLLGEHELVELILADGAENACRRLVV